MKRDRDLGRVRLIPILLLGLIAVLCLLHPGKTLEAQDEGPRVRITEKAGSVSIGTLVSVNEEEFRVLTDTDSTVRVIRSAAIRTAEVSLGQELGSWRGIGLGVLAMTGVGLATDPFQTAFTYGGPGIAFLGIPLGLLIGRMDLYERWSREVPPGIASSLLLPGRRVRVTSRTVGIERREGTLRRVGSDTISVQFEGESRERILPREDITRLEMSMGKERRRWLGAGIGLLVGAGVGSAIGYTMDGCLHSACLAWERSAILGAEVGATTAFVGFLVGAGQADVWNGVDEANSSQAWRFPGVRITGTGLKISFSLPI